MVDEPGIRFGLANGALVLVLLSASALPLGLSGTELVALITAAVAAARLPWPVGAILGVEAWAFFTGFFENQHGVLTLASHDILTLAGFVLMTVALARLMRSRLTTNTREDAQRTTSSVSS